MKYLSQISTTICLLLLLVSTRAASNKKLFPDTTDGFHWFLVFDTPILMSNETIDAKPYDLVWGASDRILPMYRATNPDIALSLYIPWSRDNDGTHDVAYWNTVHPDWVLYKCDKVTPAFQFTDPHVPLDISNPEVIEWQLQKYIGMVHQFNYDGIAADNFAIGNALNACGIWKNGQWIQKWSGTWDDTAYNNDALNWIKTFYKRLTELSPDISFGINFSLNLMDPNDPRVVSVIENLDYVMDEAGFTNWGYSMPTPAVWENINKWVENIQAKGKHYFGINEFSVLTPQAKEWGMASYLMSKNDHSSMVATIVQGYGVETKMPEYDALNVGSPIGKRVFNTTNQLYFREYSNGLVVVNVYNDTKTFSLPNDEWRYRDVLGNTYGPSKPVTVPGQSGIVMGATARPPTTTIATTTTQKPTTGGGGTIGRISTGTTGMSTTTTASASASSTSKPSQTTQTSTKPTQTPTSDSASGTGSASSDDNTTPSTSTGKIFQLPSSTSSPSTGSNDGSDATSASSKLHFSLSSLVLCLAFLLVIVW